MTKHARGRVTAAPDIAGDLERTLELLRYCASRISVDTVARYSNCALRALENAEGGDSREHVVGGLAEEAASIADAHLRAASRELSQHIDMPSAALRTRAGWNKALEREGYGEDAFDRIDSLPGTLLVLAVRDMATTAELRNEARNGDLAVELRRRWDTATTSRRSFDAVIDREAVRHPFVSEIGWALINLEGRRHINLIWHQANKLQRSLPDREAAELLTWGWLGLRTALRNYNPNLGFAFSTYACTRIVGAIRDGVRAESPVPKRLGTMARKAAAVEADLVQSLGRNPTFEEITEALAIEAGTLHAIRRTRTPLSIEETLLNVDRSGGGEPGWLAAREDAETDAILAVEAERIAYAIDQLPSEEAEAIRLLVIEDRSPTEARQIAGVTARQLRQRKERGLAALRKGLDDLAR